MSRVALIGENSIEYINKLIEIWNEGNCAVLIDWRIPLNMAIEMMREANVKECHIEEKFVKPIELNEIIFKSYINKYLGAHCIPKETYENFRENYSRDEAIIIYSSGTTGRAKGIILSHYAINTNADAIIDYMRPNINDCIYFPKTFSHSSSITGEILVALKTKIKAIVAPIIVPPRYVFNNIEKYGVSIICVNPTLLHMYSLEYEKGNYELKSLHTIYVSGSILTDQAWEKAHKTFCNINVYNVYGLSEAGPRVTAQRRGCCQSNSVGKAINGVEIFILGDSGQTLPKNQYGVVYVNTPSRFMGYVVGSKKLDSLYKDWLNTGDVGYIDDNNELHIVDRVDDVIIIDSHKIYPTEVEKQIVNNTSVKECSVTKVEINGNKFIGCLYVSEKELSFDIREALKTKLMTYEIPKLFLRTKELPRNHNGKISTSEVQAHIKRHIIGRNKYDYRDS